MRDAVVLPALALVLLACAAEGPARGVPASGMPSGSGGVAPTSDATHGASGARSAETHAEGESGDGAGGARSNASGSGSSGTLAPTSRAAGNPGGAGNSADVAAGAGGMPNGAGGMDENVAGSAGSSSGGRGGRHGIEPDGEGQLRYARLGAPSSGEVGVSDAAEPESDIAPDGAEDDEARWVVSLMMAAPRARHVTK